MQPAELLAYDVETTAMRMQVDPGLVQWRPKELAEVIAARLELEAGGKPRAVVEEAMRRLQLPEAAPDQVVAKDGAKRGRGSDGGGVRKAAMRVIAALGIDLTCELQT